jgi:DNA-binding transcriptional MocR family regulator
VIEQIQLEPSSGVPLYRQLFVQLKEMILSGQLRPGERLPASRELAGRLGLNRTTITAAYELLQAEGLIRGHVGRGSYVATGPAMPGIPWDKILPSWESAPAPPQPTSAGLISFATSRPAEQLFPLEDVRRTAEEVLGSPHARTILQLGSPAGYGPLREYLADEARRRGVLREKDDVLVTSGCQQALDLLQRVLVRPGDAVILEDPVYPGLKTLFQRAGARVMGARGSGRSGSGRAGPAARTPPSPAGRGHARFPEPHRRHPAGSGPPEPVADGARGRRRSGGKRHLPRAAL